MKFHFIKNIYKRKMIKIKKKKKRKEKKRKKGNDERKIIDLCY